MRGVKSALMTIAVLGLTAGAWAGCSDSDSGTAGAADTGAADTVGDTGPGTTDTGGGDVALTDSGAPDVTADGVATDVPGITDGTGDVAIDSGGEPDVPVSPVDSGSGDVPAPTDTIDAADAADASSDTGSPPPTLFEELGGLPALQATVDGWLDALGADPVLDCFFDGTDLEALKPLMVDFLCEATGGPCQYQGKDMKSAHAGLGIGDVHFIAFTDDLVTAMAPLGIDADAQGKLLNLLGDMASDVIAAPEDQLPACNAPKGPTYSEDVQPILQQHCSPCHTTLKSGGVNHASSYADTQVASKVCAGKLVGECVIVRIKDGSMPFGKGCTGDPAADASNPACLTADEQATVQAWVDAGQPE